MKLPNTEQEDIYDFIKNENGENILSPLTLLFSYSLYPSFAKSFYSQISFDTRKKVLLDCIRKYSGHQEHCTTDIRFSALYYLLISDRLYLHKNMLQELILYPQLDHADEKMRYIRPLIRSAEGIFPMGDKNLDYINFFWRKISIMTECNPFLIEYEKDDTNQEKLDFKNFLTDVVRYYTDIYRTINPLDKKLLVLLGILTYSYKRFSEIIAFSLYNSIVGRSIVRVLIEDYIMMKYLVKKESEKTNIWDEYQSYGIGQLKLIVSRYRENPDELEMSHVEYKYLELIVNDYMNEEFLNMDTKYFDKLGIREKADYVQEKSLFGLYYDYDSSFEHGLWGAIRETTLLKCDSAGHQYHCIPDVSCEQKCKSVWHDSKIMMVKTVKTVSNIYQFIAVQLTRQTVK